MKSKRLGLVDNKVQDEKEGTPRHRHRLNQGTSPPPQCFASSSRPPTPRRTSNRSQNRHESGARERRRLRPGGALAAEERTVSMVAVEGGVGVEEAEVQEGGRGRGDGVEGTEKESGAMKRRKVEGGESTTTTPQGAMKMVLSRKGHAYFEAKASQSTFADGAVDRGDGFDEPLSRFEYNGMSARDRSVSCVSAAGGHLLR